MNEYDIWSALLEDVTKSGKDACGYIGEILTLLHDIEVVIRLHIENLENLIKHFAMLTSNAHEDRKSTRLNSSHANISYAVFCLKKKPHNNLQPGRPRRHHAFAGPPPRIGTRTPSPTRTTLHRFSDCPTSPLLSSTTIRLSARRS